MGEGREGEDKDVGEGMAGDKAGEVNRIVLR